MLFPCFVINGLVGVAQWELHIHSTWNKSNQVNQLCFLEGAMSLTDLLGSLGGDKEAPTLFILLLINY